MTQTKQEQDKKDVSTDSTAYWLLPGYNKILIQKQLRDLWPKVLKLYEIRLQRVVGFLNASATLQIKFAAPTHLYEGQFPYATGNMERTIAESSLLSNTKKKTTYGLFLSCFTPRRCRKHTNIKFITIHF